MLTHQVLKGLLGAGHRDHALQGVCDVVGAAQAWANLPERRTQYRHGHSRGLWIDLPVELMRGRPDLLIRLAFGRWEPAHGGCRQPPAGALREAGRYRPVAGHGRVEELPQRVDVDGFLIGPAELVFAGLGTQGCIDQQADDLDVAVGGDDDRVGVDPQMEQTAGVQRRQSYGDLVDDEASLLGGQRPGCQQRLQRIADRVLADHQRPGFLAGRLLGVQHPQEPGVDHRGRPASGLQHPAQPFVLGLEQVDQHRAGQDLVDRPPGHHAVTERQQRIEPVPARQHQSGGHRRQIQVPR